jgi:hypothetical protein
MRPLPNPLIPGSLLNQVYIKRITIPKHIVRALGGIEVGSYYFAVIDFYQAGEVYINGYQSYRVAKRDYLTFKRQKRDSLLEMLEAGKADRKNLTHILRLEGIRQIGYNHASST